MLKDVNTRATYAEAIKKGSAKSQSSQTLLLLMGGRFSRNLHRSSCNPNAKEPISLISPTPPEEQHLKQDKKERERGKRRNRGREGGQTKQEQQRIEQEEKATKKSPQAKRERKEKKISDSHMHTNSETHCTPLLADKQRKKQPRSKEQRKRQQDERRKEGSRGKREQSKNYTKKKVHNHIT
jgi:hypothetical protein